MLETKISAFTCITADTISSLTLYTIRSSDGNDACSSCVASTVNKTSAAIILHSHNTTGFESHPEFFSTITVKSINIHQQPNNLNCDDGYFRHNACKFFFANNPTVIVQQNHNLNISYLHTQQIFHIEMK